MMPGQAWRYLTGVLAIRNLPSSSYARLDRVHDMTRLVVRGTLVVLLLGAAATAGYLLRDHSTPPVTAEIGTAKSPADLTVAEALQGSFVGVARSEERRVGRECRSRWSP